MSETQPLTHAETKPPERGRSLESALAEMRRRAETPGSLAVPASQAPTYVPPPAAPAAPPAPELPPPDAVMTPPAAQAPAGQAPQAGPGTAPDDLVVQVEIDGRLEPVTIAELRRGYLREQDYRRKTQQLAADQRRSQEAQQQFVQARQLLEQRLPHYTAQLAQEFAQPIDWEKLGREDPIGAAQKVTRLLAWQQAQQEEQRLAQVAQQEQFKRKQELHAIGHDVLSRVIPGWADPPTRAVIQQAIAQHAITMGYSAEEVAKAEVLDPRDIFMAWKSMNYDRLMAQRVQPTPVGAQTMPTNGAYRRDAVTTGGADINSLEQRFQQTRRLDDALAVMRARAELAGRPASAQPPSRLRP